MDRLLLHVCCANCGLVPIELLKQKFDITLFWYNPNIQPPEEHARRLENLYQLARIYNLNYLVGPDDAQRWDKMVQDNNLTGEPEGGQRCTACFKWRMKSTAQAARKNDFPCFATTLGISRYKNTELIDLLGQEAAQRYQVQYFPLEEVDKNAAAREELKLSQTYDFYRQKYCGCLYSKIALVKNQK
ncbi:MAG: epoxyqueuosine reductase QueH [Candidatus Parcubacteria bacterium]|nr:epoxyqueuosine reductase QueH [Candidatus Parcubacteria bacterium]